jgi:hypothetical protein
MKCLLTLLLVGILGVVLYGVLDQHQNIERQDRERAERTLDECWQNAVGNGGIGADVCKGLAESLNK